LGAEVTVLSHSANKEVDAKRMGADHFVVKKDPKILKTINTILI
jgi:uncharacterized zinc-type alcohol dehydrogenase-like protein